MEETKDLMELKDLKETIALMSSDNYKDRFIAEYWQNKIRLQRLKNLCAKWDEGTLKFTPICPREIFDRQISLMEEMQKVLEERAEIESVNLTMPQSNNNFIGGFRAACDSLASGAYKMPPCRNISMMATKIVEASLWANHEILRREAK